MKKYKRVYDEFGNYTEVDCFQPRDDDIEIDVHTWDLVERRLLRMEGTNDFDRKFIANMLEIGEMYRIENKETKLRPKQAAHLLKLLGG